MTLKTFVLAALLLIALPSPAQTLRIKVKQGKLQGVQQGSVRAFLGIPYAVPPVGPLRWRPPQPPAKWHGVLNATAFGPRCMQPQIYADMLFRDPGTNEDCLTLNIWTPAKDASAKLPVMVWIYGGGYQAGGTSERRQDGANLAKNGVIVVTMNYRLGIFGFFATPELAAESPHHAAGNYGLLDQTAALQWVQKNIRAFGGDPDNVTLFGESAGSFSVNAQMASPLAKGLFRRVIGESGGALYSSKGLQFKTLDDIEARDTTFVQQQLPANPTLAQLRALPAVDLLLAETKKGTDGLRTYFGPDIDGYFLSESVPDIFAAHRQNDVPMIVGWNRDEGGYNPKTTVASFHADVARQFPQHAEDILRLYPATTDAEAVRASADLAADRFIVYSTWKWIEAQLSTGTQSIYRYKFMLPPPPDPFHPGGLAAYHSAEIPYVFGDLDLLKDFAWRPEDHALSQLMQSYWTNFAKTGDPNGPGLPQWPVYKADSGYQVMHLGPQPAAEPDHTRARHLFLDTLWGR